MKINEPEAVILLKEHEYKELLKCKEELAVIKAHISLLNDYTNRRNNK